MDAAFIMLLTKKYNLFPDAAFIMLLLTKEHKLFPLIESFIVTIVYKYKSGFKIKKRKL